MNIYLLAQNCNFGYDTYDSCVVVAPDIQTARYIHPNGNRWNSESKCWGTFNWGDWANHPDKVDVTKIGEALPNQRMGVIIYSFNPG